MDTLIKLPTDQIAAIEAVSMGLCTPQCLICSDSDQSSKECTCPCGGRFHAALAWARIGKWDQDYDPLTLLACRRCATEVDHGYLAKRAENVMCVDCFEGKGGHWYALSGLGKNCDADWHDGWDHVQGFNYFNSRRNAFALRESDWWNS